MAAAFRGVFRTQARQVSPAAQVRACNLASVVRGPVATATVQEVA